MHAIMSLNKNTKIHQILQAFKTSSTYYTYPEVAEVSWIETQQNTITKQNRYIFVLACNYN